MTSSHEERPIQRGADRGHTERATRRAEDWSWLASMESARGRSTPGKASTGKWNREAQRLRSLEDENRRLKQLVAKLSLDKEALKPIRATKRLELAGPTEDAAFAMEQVALSGRRACKLAELDRSS